MFSVLMVAVLLIVSMLLFSWLIQRLRDLQIVNVLQQIGDKGRLVIHEMFLRLDERPELEWKGGSGALDDVGLGPATQTVKYSGEPRAIAKFDIEALVRQARQAQAIIVMTCAVGYTLVDDTLMLRVHGAKTPLSEKELMGAIDLARESAPSGRTRNTRSAFWSKSPSRPSLPPSTIQPRRCRPWIRSRTCCAAWGGATWMPSTREIRMESFD
jgi:uncharacterized membrane protein